MPGTVISDGDTKVKQDIQDALVADILTQT